MPHPGPHGVRGDPVIADHRVLDGASVARALERLEAVLCQDITAELRRPPAGTRGRREAAA